MAATVHYPGADERPLEAGWFLQSTAPGAAATPHDLKGPGLRIAAPVPGTAAQALAQAGLFDPQRPTPLHDRDFWYFRSLAGEHPGPAVLRFGGLATIAEVYLNGRHMLISESMFESHDLQLTLTGDDELAICFRALEPHLQKRGPRARWRPQLADSQGLRLVRTTQLGRMPGWCPEIHPVGPWRGVSLIRPSVHALDDLTFNATLTEDGTGRLSVSFGLGRGTASDIRLHCAGREACLAADEKSVVRGTLEIPDVIPWWPHTHGTPHLHVASLLIDGHEHGLGLVGFRRLEIERGQDGRDFRLKVNGVEVFCRGAVWATADILRLSGDCDAYLPWLTLARQAGMNMLRVAGTMAYETPDFFRLCDQFGILVWQDLMFANYDYPFAEEGFRAHIEREVLQFLRGIQASPSLAILCGGSEVYQQAAMLGLPQAAWRSELFSDFLPKLAAFLSPGIPYVENSPCGGSVPFAVNEGVSHYYGVGAYCRPLEDARRADIRFAGECLAFAHVPQQQTLDRTLPVPPVVHPKWKERVPRDRGASWDFDDIRDHYLQLLYGFDPTRLRREDPARYLDFSRATTGEVLEETFAEWRRAESRCGGALVWTLQDLMPGAGWGVIDSTGEPKPVWHAMKRAFRPVQVVLTDEGTNGLDIHLINDGGRPVEAHLHIACLRQGLAPVVTGERAVVLEPRSTRMLHATDLFGAFFDTTYAFRFGPPSHDVTVARLVDVASGATVAEAFHYPLGRAAALHDSTISATLKAANDGWQLELSTDRLAQSVHISSDTHRAEEDWFHLAPSTTRSVRLHRRDDAGGDAGPSGTIAHLGSARHFSF